MLFTPRRQTRPSSLRAATRVAVLAALATSALASPTAPALQDPAPKPQEISAGPWIADFDQAAKLAKEQKKDLLVDFTGSDWCGWCKRLDAEVFSHAEFVDAATKQYVLVKLDYPQGEAAKQKVPNPQRNEEQKVKYGIGGYPTILLMNADGEAFASTGYQPGGPAKYVEHLATVREEGLKVVPMLERWRKAEGQAKTDAWEEIAKAYEAFEPQDILGLTFAPALRDALRFDADNAQGRKLRALKLLLGKGRADAEDFAAARQFDPKNEHGLLEKVVLAEYDKVADDESAKKALDSFDALGEVKDKETALMLNAHSAAMARQIGDLPRAKAYAQKAKAIGTDNERLMAFLDSIINS